ncbi:hypothetical protein NHX12_002937 [Muraenolepis orangiensis]|uniref:small monomeric GTPase n=1 Tax=Muraenolepis orangiensis TaxID=630683 RepID=A0A9Q0IGS1_9TELE|nr:hypothetical protein NHX12_002937 [Muraenolepis orangiensis]
METLRLIRETRTVDNCRGDVEVPVCLVGNKQDLCHARQVREEEGRSLSMSLPGGVEGFEDIAGVFTELIRHVMENNLKDRADRCRYAGPKSMAKLITTVFGKRRKSV